MTRILNSAKAATCSHLLPAATCSHLQPLGPIPTSSFSPENLQNSPAENTGEFSTFSGGSKWLQVAASVCWEQVAASGCSSGCSSGCKWLQVAASGCSGCKWLLGASGCKWQQVAAQVAASGCKWLQVAARPFCGPSAGYWISLLGSLGNGRSWPNPGREPFGSKFLPFGGC